MFSFALSISLELHIQHVQEYPPPGNSISTQDSQIWVQESSPVIEEPVQEEHEEIPLRGFHEQDTSKGDENLVEHTVGSHQTLVVVVLYSLPYELSRRRSAPGRH